MAVMQTGRTRHGVHPAEQDQHRLIEISQAVIFQFQIIPQRPLPPRIMITPSVALAREIHPLGVPELIAHEI